MVRWHFWHPEMQVKHVLLALGVDRTARDPVKAKFTGVPFMFTHCIGLVSPRLARHQENAVELATKDSVILT